MCIADSFTVLGDDIICCACSKCGTVTDAPGCWSGLRFRCRECSAINPAPVGTLGEEWKPTIHFGELYQASSLGRIRSVRKLKKGWKCSLIAQKPGSVCKKSGYRNGALRKSGERISFHAHELVWEAHNGPVPTGLVVAHKDARRDAGGALSNRLDNLHLQNRSGNGHEAVQQGLLPIGEKHHRAKVKESIVCEMREQRAAAWTLAKIQARLLSREGLELSVGQIGNIVTHRAWKHVHCASINRSADE